MSGSSVLSWMRASGGNAVGKIEIREENRSGEERRFTSKNPLNSKKIRR